MEDTHKVLETIVLFYMGNIKMDFNTWFGGKLVVAIHEENMWFHLL